MNTLAPVGENDVKIKLGSKEVVLRATLGAALAISRRDGGLVPTISKLASLDFDTIQFVIEQGIGQKAKEIPKLIMETGVSKLAPECIKFIRFLSRGPGPHSDEGEEDDENDGSEGSKGPLAEGG